ncbi:hypothetical protein CO614_03365 [Lysobacteraceae bacterium NML120232]|nr:hypothetical protein CO608_00125 [Xanthomonadaceae bacterium NML08-0793]PJK12794.1 hypothetical protein CO614_03365 [Xanthomonadaceae bacterium NML120232]
MNHYLLMNLLHLFAAFLFVGVVFFEVLFLGSIRKRLPDAIIRPIEKAIGQRAVQLMPWTLLLLYGSGVGMAWRYRAALADPLGNSFGLLLAVKIALALSVFGHFLTAMALRRRGRLIAGASKRIHISVFCHMLGIILLAKLMFALSW